MTITNESQLSLENIYSCIILKTYYTAPQRLCKWQGLKFLKEKYCNWLNVQDKGAAANNAH